MLMGYYVLKRLGGRGRDPKCQNDHYLCKDARVSTNNSENMRKGNKIVCVIRQQMHDRQPL